MDDVQRAVAFLTDIGLRVRLGEVPADSFLPKITIADGELVYEHGVAISDLLHEAGHIAIIPAKYRHMCQANISKSQRAIWDAADKAGETDPDAPICRALLQSEDQEATAWAYAAGKQIGLADEVIVPDHEYQGTGESIRLGLALKAYIGINGLRAAGMLASVKDYPQLTQWVQQ